MQVEHQFRIRRVIDRKISKVLVYRSAANTSQEVCHDRLKNLACIKFDQPFDCSVPDIGQSAWNSLEKLKTRKVGQILRKMMWNTRISIISIEIGQSTLKKSIYVDFVRKKHEIANVSTIPAVRAIFVSLCAVRRAVARGGVRWDVRWRAVACGGRQKSHKQKENDGNIFMLCGVDEFGTIITKTAKTCSCDVVWTGLG